MSDGIRGVEPYDEITTWWEVNGDVEGECFRAYGGEEGENGDGAWTWIESNIGDGNWCFCEWVQEGYPMVKETVLELKVSNNSRQDHPQSAGEIDLEKKMKKLFRLYSDIVAIRIVSIS
jgi:hypothetical protein